MPTKGSKLYLQRNIWEILWAAGMLETVSNNNKVHIEQEEYLRVKEELKWHKYRKGEAGWLKKLLNRISAGIGDGKYVTLHPGMHDDTNEESDVKGGLEYK